MKRFAKITALCIVLTLLSALFCAPLQALGVAEEKHIISTGSVGEGVGKSTTLVDFTARDLCGFETLGNTSAPSFEYSGTCEAPVLYAWIDPAENETGIRGTLETAAPLQGADTLSIQLLAQYKKGTSYTVTLQLTGTNKNGAPLSLTASAVAPSKNWQTVTFDISAFVAEVDFNAPCAVKLLTSSTAEESEQFVLWVCSIYTSQIISFPEFILPTAAAAVGFLFGFALFFVIYRATCKRKRRPLWEGH